MFCKYCGKELADSAKFCSKCGKQLGQKEFLNVEESSESQRLPKSDETEIQESLKFCKFCGEHISASAKFCPKCGENLISKPAEKTDSYIQEIKETKRTNTEIGNIEFKDFYTNGRHFLYTGDSHRVFCPSCKKRVDSSATICSWCNTSFMIPTNEKPVTSESSGVIQSAVSEQKKSEDESNNVKFLYYEKFTVKNLFVQVFKKHTAQERDEILKAGLSEQDLNNVKISPKKLQPWFYSRVFLILLAVFGIFEICLLSFYNTNIMPGIMLIGSVMVPFSLLTMYFELNVYKDISFYKVIGIFLLGGAVSLLFTLFLYEIIPTTDDFNFLGASLISIIEEVGKAVVVILLLNRTKNATVLHGILIGGAIGCGFAVFESAGYAFNRYLDAHDYNTRADIVNSVLPWYYQYDYADSWSEMNFTIFLRSVLSFGGHTAWAAITGAAFAKAKKINLDFIKPFAICFVLHAIWDTDTPAPYFKLICLCFGAWWVIIKQIANFVEENKLTIKK